VKHQNPTGVNARVTRMNAGEIIACPHSLHLSCYMEAPSKLGGKARRTVQGGDHLEYDVKINGFEEAAFVLDASVSVALTEGSAVRVTFSPSGPRLPPARGP
jgi:hypothetical protein